MRARDARGRSGGETEVSIGASGANWGATGAGGQVIRVPAGRSTIFLSGAFAGDATGCVAAGACVAAGCLAIAAFVLGDWLLLVAEDVGGGFGAFVAGAASAMDATHRSVATAYALLDPSPCRFTANIVYLAEFLSRSCYRHVLGGAEAGRLTKGSGL